MDKQLAAFFADAYRNLMFAGNWDQADIRRSMIEQGLATKGVSKEFEWDAFELTDVGKAALASTPPQVTPRK